MVNLEQQLDNTKKAVIEMGVSNYINGVLYALDHIRIAKEEIQRLPETSEVLAVLNVLDVLDNSIRINYQNLVENHNKKLTDYKISAILK